jgi:hypothetical protein
VSRLTGSNDHSGMPSLMGRQHFSFPSISGLHVDIALFPFLFVVVVVVVVILGSI